MQINLPSDLEPFVEQEFATGRMEWGHTSSQTHGVPGRFSLGAFDRSVWQASTIPREINVCPHTIPKLVSFYRATNGRLMM